MGTGNWKGKWYKTYWRFSNDPATARNHTLKVFAFSFSSAAQTTKIKLAKEKNYDEEKIVVVRVDLLT